MVSILCCLHGYHYIATIFDVRKDSIGFTAHPSKFTTCGIENYLTSSGYYLHRERLGIFLGIVFVSLSLRQVEGWMSLSHGLNGPPSTWITANRLEIALEEQHHTVHHTLAVDPTPGEKIPGRPASSRTAGLTFRPIKAIQVGGCSNRCCKKEYWAFDQKSVDQEAGQPKGDRPA